MYARKANTGTEIAGTGEGLEAGAEIGSCPSTAPEERRSVRTGARAQRLRDVGPAPGRGDTEGVR